jgi:Uma2 family endonuclease
VIDLIEEFEFHRPPPIGPLSLDAYFAITARAADRYEYVDGRAYAMGGGSRRHHDVSFNVASALRGRCAGTPCRTYTQVFRVRTPRNDVYVPDVMVSCGPPPGEDALHLDDPCLLVEVVSPSTARSDAMEKRVAYQEIPAARAYLIAETAWRAVHRHWRDDAGEWRRETIAGPDGIVPLPCPTPDALLTLAEIYAGLNVPAEPPYPWRVYERLGEAPVGA